MPIHDLIDVGVDMFFRKEWITQENAVFEVVVDKKPSLQVSTRTTSRSTATPATTSSKSTRSNTQIPSLELPTSRRDQGSIATLHRVRR